MNEFINKNILGDCLDVMPQLINNDIKVDLIIADLPYGVTKNSWDSVIPFDLLWKNYNELINENATIILFGQGMFTAKLMMSNEKMWKYNLIWNKVLTSGFLNAKRQPMRCHEDIVVFYNKRGTYNPIKTEGAPEHGTGIAKGNSPSNNNNYGNYIQLDNAGNTLKYPKSIISISRYHSSKMIHATQKPIELIEYLIKTYSNEGDLVLDNTAGVFTTSIACKLTKRNFICIEKNEEYYNKGIEYFNKYNYLTFI